MALVNELLGVDVAPGTRGTAEFEVCVAASNGWPIPQDLVVQARLHDCAGHAQARLLRHEFEHKTRLIDRDRRFAACLCDILPLAPEASAGLADCLAALAPPAVPRVLVFPLSAAQTVSHALPAGGGVLELVAVVDVDLAPARARAHLEALRTRLERQPGARLVAVLRGRVPADGAHELLHELLAAADALFLLPLLCENGDEVAARRARYGALASTTSAAGLARLAPGLYAKPEARAQERPWLNRLTARLPQCDVLGLGPAACSRFNEVRFDNLPALRDYAHDIARGGFAIAHAWTRTPLEQLVEALLFGLASGAVVDVRALAQRCQCASPPVLAACDESFSMLGARGAVSGSPQQVALDSPNDAYYPEIRAALTRLRETQPPVTSLARR